jgi:hypothetical protein
VCERAEEGAVGRSAVPNSGSDPLAEQQNPEQERGVEDARRRGWFWHWNTIITQYAPLVGLKGVGLLNSYTVWTDRREESPLHGYAFPTQQAEADFYGEDRAELITINKILVALGLIEIRKEMVLRVDERGRRWRVPHNLYRVRDHQNGYNLTIEDVLRVVELAATDQPVYRSIRRIFSPRFAPIDSDNVWHQILPVLREHPGWQELAQRALKEDARTSARTKAGHARRSKPSNETSNSLDSVSRQEGDGGDSGVTLETKERTGSQSSVAPTNQGSAITVAMTNNGSGPDDDRSNNGLDQNEETIADQRNEGGDNNVGQSNTTYNQVSNTTTTTTTASVTQLERARENGAGPVPGPSLAVVACFEAANNRPATPLEAELLAELERAFAGRAQRAGETGSAWVVAAIREAVSSGSRFVAPKRVREILNRWASASDGVRPGVAPPPEAITIMSSPPPGDFALPHGQGANATWEHTLRLLSSVMEQDEIERLLAGSSIRDYRAGTVKVLTTSREAAERLSVEYYDLVSRKLAEAMRRPVRIEFFSSEAAPGEKVGPPVAERAPDRTSATVSNRPLPLPSFMLAGGLTNQQLWSMALDALATRFSPATWETWVRPVALIGADEDGTLVLGAPNAFAQRRLASRLLDEIARVLSELLDRPVGARVVVTQEWLRQREAGQPGEDEREE